MRIKRAARKRSLASCKVYSCLFLAVYLVTQVLCLGLLGDSLPRSLFSETNSTTLTTRNDLARPSSKDSSWIKSKERLPGNEKCFSADLARTARLLRSQRQSGVPLPLPIINLGLPKVGSTTMAQFFECGGLKSNHWKIYSEENSVFVGKCMQEASTHGRLPLGYCEEQAKTKSKFDSWLQMDYILKGECYFPQISHLEALHKENPSATFMLLSRPAEDWFWSLVDWHRMDKRIRRDCNFGIDLWDHDPKEGFRRFWCDHVNRVRAFVAKHPSHKLIELELYDERNARVMSELFNIDRKCWGHGKDSMNSTETTV